MYVLLRNAIPMGHLRPKTRTPSSVPKTRPIWGCIVEDSLLGTPIPMYPWSPEGPLIILIIRYRTISGLPENAPSTYQEQGLCDNPQERTIWQALSCCGFKPWGFFWHLAKAYNAHCKQFHAPVGNLKQSSHVSSCTARRSKTYKSEQQQPDNIHPQNENRS